MHTHDLVSCSFHSIIKYVSMYLRCDKSICICVCVVVLKHSDVYW